MGCGNIPETDPEWSFPEQAPPVVRPAAREGAEEFVAPEGFGDHVCLRDCGYGRFLKGRIYALPDGQDPKVFRKL